MQQGGMKMFEFLRRKRRSPTAAEGDGLPPLIFKDGVAAIRYACDFLEFPQIEEGSLLPALVLNSRELFGTATAVKIEANGNQLAIIRVASRDGGFMVAASTAGPKGPRLQPDQLVAWQAMQYSPELAQKAKDKRFGWIGLIIGTLKPEHRNGGWVGHERFTS